MTQRIPSPKIKCGDSNRHASCLRRKDPRIHDTRKLSEDLLRLLTCTVSESKRTGMTSSGAEGITGTARTKNCRRRPRRSFIRKDAGFMTRGKDSRTFSRLFWCGVAGLGLLGGVISWLLGMYGFLLVSEPAQ